MSGTYWQGFWLGMFVAFIAHEVGYAVRRWFGKRYLIVRKDGDA